MHHPKKLGLIANLILCFVLQTLGADKYTDENRPYEFGFKIDGQQHRHESKDVDGIIMGEFGFVTADDVYHVTVYATDKEGRFKILSMKNIHLKSTSDLGFGAPGSARQGHALSLPPAPAASVKVSAIPQQPPKQAEVSTQPRLGPFTPQAGPVSQAPQPGKPSKPVSIEPPAKSCSSCSVPTTTTRAPPAYNQATINNNYNSPNQLTGPGSSPQNQQAFLSTHGHQNKAQGGPISSSYSPQEGQQSFAPGQQNVPQSELVAPNGAQSFAPQPGQAVQNFPSSPSYSQGPGVSNTPNNVQGGPNISPFSTPGGQQSYPSSQQNFPQGGFIAPGGAQPASAGAARPGQIPQNYPGSPNYSQGPGVPSAPNNVQGRPSGLSYSAPGGQQNYPSSQQNIPQGGSIAPGGAQSFAPQLGPTPQNYPGSPNYSQGPGIPSAPNNGQGRPSGSSPSPREGQQNYPSNQQNTPQGGLVSPGGVQSFVPQQGQMPQNNPGSPSYSNGPGIPSAPNNGQGRPSGSSPSPREGQQNYPSNQQNTPQGGLVSPGGVQSFVPQQGRMPQNNPGLPNYSNGPGIPNAPNNYAQPRGEAGQPAGLLPTNSGEQNNLFSGNNNPYPGVGPSGSASSVPDAGNFGQNIAQQAGAAGPFKAQPTGKTSHPQGGTGERTSKQYKGPEQQFNSNTGPNGPQSPGAALGARPDSAKPTLVSAQMQIVDKNTDIYALGPNEQKGLPPGLSHGDMAQLLYTFNYTVGFHGHFEEGYANGAKQGYYFVTGRNGVRTRIDYVADDTGFHPKVSQEVLDLLSEDVPKPDTEKDEKYGLKGYEFKWLYYPVETKAR